jgi:hypothetical protein
LSGVASPEEVLQDVFKPTISTSGSPSSEASELVEDLLLAEATLTLIGVFGSSALSSVSCLVVELSLGGVGEDFVGAA